MKKVKMADGKWILFEEDEKLWVSHFCSGKPGINARERSKPWFHKAVDTEKETKCPACDTEVPNNLKMVIELKNFPG